VAFVVVAKQLTVVIFIYRATT